MFHVSSQRIWEKHRQPETQSEVKKNHVCNWVPKLNLRRQATTKRDLLRFPKTPTSPHPPSLLSASSSSSSSAPPRRSVSQMKHNNYSYRYYFCWIIIRSSSFHSFHKYCAIQEYSRMDKPQSRSSIDSIKETGRIFP